MSGSEWAVSTEHSDSIPRMCREETRALFFVQVHVLVGRKKEYATRLGRVKGHAREPRHESAALGLGMRLKRTLGK